jgi:hypothetical protein
VSGVKGKTLCARISLERHGMARSTCVREPYRPSAPHQQFHAVPPSIVAFAPLQEECADRLERDLQSPRSRCERARRGNLLVDIPLAIHAPISNSYSCRAAGRGSCFGASAGFAFRARRAGGRPTPNPRLGARTRGHCEYGMRRSRVARPGRGYPRLSCTSRAPGGRRSRDVPRPARPRGAECARGPTLRRGEGPGSPRLRRAPEWHDRPPAVPHSGRPP